MVPYFSDTKLLSEKEYYKLMEKGDIVNLGEVLNFNNGYYLIVVNRDLEEIEKFNSSNTANVSIGIAAATTAYSRIVMSKFKNNPLFNLYYFDTDSLVLNISPDKLEEIYPGILGKGLGQLKLEHEIDKAGFLSPKCYFLENTNGDKIIKIKGFNLKDNANGLEISDFISLLQKDSNLKLTQSIWVKDKSEALISIIDQAYNLTHNDNKREIIYNKYNFFVDSKPIQLNMQPQKIENAD